MNSCFLKSSMQQQKERRISMLDYEQVKERVNHESEILPSLVSWTIVGMVIAIVASVFIFRWSPLAPQHACGASLSPWISYHNIIFIISLPVIIRQVPALCAHQEPRFARMTASAESSWWSPSGMHECLSKRKAYQGQAGTDRSRLRRAAKVLPGRRDSWSLENNGLNLKKSCCYIVATWKDIRTANKHRKLEQIKANNKEKVPRRLNLGTFLLVEISGIEPLTSWMPFSHQKNYSKCYFYK